MEQNVFQDAHSTNCKSVHKMWLIPIKLLLYIFFILENDDKCGGGRHNFIPVAEQPERSDTFKYARSIIISGKKRVGRTKIDHRKSYRWSRSCVAKFKDMRVSHGNQGRPSLRSSTSTAKTNLVNQICGTGMWHSLTISYSPQFPH